MRAVRLSKTFLEEFDRFIAEGEDSFGVKVATEKRAKVRDTIANFLARHPRAKRSNLKLGLTVYPIDDTPFMVLYDFDRRELRLHFIFKRGFDLRSFDPTSAEW